MVEVELGVEELEGGEREEGVEGGGIRRLGVKDRCGALQEARCVKRV